MNLIRRTAASVLALGTVAPAQSPTPRPAREPEPVRYLVVPLEGRFGEGVVPAGVADALDQADQKVWNTPFIVFTIDSEGGSVWAAEQIADLMRAHDGSFQYVAIVRKAVGPALWVVALCDHVLVTSDGVIGGQAPLLWEHRAGSTLDRSGVATAAAALSGAFDTRERPGAAIRAMVQPEATLHSWRAPGGGIMLGAAAPPGAEAQVLDGPASVLTLTAEAAVSLGVADGVGEFDGLDALGDVLAPETGWKTRGTAGEKAMREAARALADDQDALERALAGIAAAAALVPDQVRAAENLEPGDRVFVYPERDDETGRPTADYRRRWAAAVDRSIDAWEAVLDTLTALKGHVDRARSAIRRLPGPLGESGEGRLDAAFDLARAKADGARAEEAIKRLRLAREFPP